MSNVYKAKLYVGPCVIKQVADKLRVPFGYLNVLEGTEHVIVLAIHADTLDGARERVLTAMQVHGLAWAGSPDVASQNVVMRGRQP